MRDEIKTGKATILCSLDNEKPKEYEIEIEEIYKENNYDNKSMLIKVTDEELLEKTGGIIQGMSGSPIIQNGKFVGAVTHVLVKNPTEGYRSIWRYNVKTSKRSRIKIIKLLKKIIIFLGVYFFFLNKCFYVETS